MSESGDANDIRLPSARPPAYARIALILFGLSLAFCVFSAWAWLSGRTQAFHRGYSPFTAEWKTHQLWIGDPYIGRVFRCDVDERGENELGRPYAYFARPIGESGLCFRSGAVDGPVFAVAVGDSFTFGHQVEFSSVWTEQLGRAINRGVVNLGVAMSSPTQYLRVFERVGAPLKPKVVIMTTYVNDWLDEACVQAWWSLRQTLGEQVDFPRSEAISETIRKNAYRVPPHWNLPPLDAVVSCDIGGQIYYFDASAFAAQDTLSPTIAAGRRSSEGAILALRDAVRGIGARFLVVVIPAKEQVYHEHVARLIPYARAAPQDVFCAATAEWCRKHDIDVIDMLPILRARAAAGEHPYFPRDGHFREEGNALLAEILVEHLRRLGLPGAP